MKLDSGTVYSKALVVFLVASLLLLGAVAILTQTIILREFNLSEQREMKALLQRFTFVMAHEVKPIETFLATLARSPLVANYASGKTMDLRSSKIDEDTLREQKIDFVCLYDREGNLLRMVCAEKTLEALLDGGEGVTNVLNRSQIGSLANRKEALTGYAVLHDELCFVTIASIEADGDTETSAGYLVGGRFFRKGSWTFLEGAFAANFAFNPFKNTKVNEVTGKDIITLLNSQEAVVDAEESSQIMGYRLIRGITGGPLGYVSVSQTRPLRQEGLRAIQIFLVGITLAGGALVFVVWILLDRTILKRIKDLTRELEVETRTGRLPVKLEFQGSDELGLLARGIEGLAVRLQSTQSQYRAVVEDQTDIICRFDSDLRIGFANQIFLRMFDLQGRQLSECFLTALLPEQENRNFEEKFAALSPENTLTVFTHQINLKNGQNLWLRSTLRRSFLQGGECQGGQWVATDITAQVAAQKQMLESERRFRRLFETASDGILLLEGRDLVVTDINPSLCRMLLLAGTEILGRSLNEMPAFSPCARTVAHYRDKMTEGSALPSARAECRLERVDGTVLFAELFCSSYEVQGGKYIQVNFRNISERIQNERQLRQLSARLLRLQDDERRRIARELHDSTAQNLSALEMNMSLLEPLLGKLDSNARRIVGETRQIAAECSKELRNISYLLHPPLIDEVGLAFAIKWFCDGFAKRTGITATVEIDEDFPRLDADLEMPLFRVVQEAMTNVYRHSGADHAWVTLHRTGQQLFLEVRDNGKGFVDGVLGTEGAEPDVRTDWKVGVGLAGMRERLLNLGGKLGVESSPLGATISIHLLMEPPHADN
ncbi:hypothetical protein BH09VER1_BH09VER1_09810 [soil metagenome]